MMMRQYLLYCEGGLIGDAYLRSAGKVIDQLEANTPSYFIRIRPRAFALRFHDNVLAQLIVPHGFN